jgi:hypothetical protein
MVAANRFAREGGDQAHTREGENRVMHRRCERRRFKFREVAHRDSSVNR